MKHDYCADFCEGKKEMEEQIVDRESDQEMSDRGNEPGVEEGAAPMIAGTALVVDVRDRSLPVHAVSVTRNCRRDTGVGTFWSCGKL